MDGMNTIECEILWSGTETTHLSLYADGLLQLKKAIKKPLGFLLLTDTNGDERYYNLSKASMIIVKPAKTGE